MEKVQSPKNVPVIQIYIVYVSNCNPNVRLTASDFFFDQDLPLKTALVQKGPWGRGQGGKE